MTEVSDPQKPTSGDKPDGSRLVRRVKRAVSSVFLKNVLVLMSGTTLAQVISVSMAPVLSRVYDIPAYGVYGLYASIVSIFGVIGTLRYDQALMLPKDDRDASNLMLLACTCTVATAILVTVAAAPLGPFVGRLAGSDGPAAWVWLIPVAIVAMGVSETLKSWATRRKLFKHVSASQVARGLVGPGSQYVGGVGGFGTLGLVVGSLLGDLSVLTTLFWKIWRTDSRQIRAYLDARRMRALAKEYSDFPIYSGSQSLLNSFSQNVPILLMASYFGTTVLGSYALAVRILQLPMNLTLASLRQVFFQKASEVHNAGGDDFALFRTTTLGMLGIAALPTLAVFLFGPSIFAFVLGAKWHTAGEYARWLATWHCVGFINSPATLYAQVYRKQNILLMQDAGMLIFRVMALVVGGAYLSALNTVIAYSAVGIAFNGVIILWAYVFLKRERRLRLV